MTIAISSLESLLAASTGASATSSSVTSWSTVRSNVFAAVSSELGISQSDLQTQLKSGKSMADIASAAGVSADDLKSTIMGALQQSDLPAGVDLGTMATRMANNVNNASLDDGPVGTSAAAASTTGSSPGIDTSANPDVQVGNLMLDPSEVSMLLGSTGSTLDTYL